MIIDEFQAIAWLQMGYCSGGTSKTPLAAARARSCVARTDVPHRIVDVVEFQNLQWHDYRL